MLRGLQYQYDPNGRMIWSANLDGSNPATSVYDGLGQRVQTTQAGVTKRYFYDMSGSVVAEYEATGSTGYGALKRLNVSAAGRLLAVDEVQTDGSKVTSYLMADRQGSTRLLMNAAGAVTSRHDYLPFGEELGAGTGAPGSPTGMRTAAQGYSAADNVRERYADTRLDDATGLDHTLWRKLETRSGRWTSPDPYGKSLRVVNPQSFNRYAYVRNDPMNARDRTGLDDCAGEYNATGQCTIGDGGSGTIDGWFGGDTGIRIVDPSPGEPTGGGPIEPQETERPLTDDQRKIVDDAVELALLKLLAYKECRDYILSGNKDLNPFDVLKDLKASGFTYFNGVVFASGQPQGISTARGEGATGHIVLGYHWFQPGVGGLSTSSDFPMEITDKQARVENILHELKHLFGPIHDGTQGSSSADFNKNIYSKCNIEDKKP
jgi:RHS repeat-associated protein